MVTIRNFQTCCDHSGSLVTECRACNRLDFWRVFVVYVSVMGGCAGLIGLVLIMVH